MFLIDKDKLWSEFAGSPPNYYSTSYVMSVIDRQELVDAVQVTRCSKCRIHGNCYTEDVFRVSGISDGFCAAGRKNPTDYGGK